MMATRLSLLAGALLSAAQWAGASPRLPHSPAPPLSHSPALPSLLAGIALLLCIAAGAYSLLCAAAVRAFFRRPRPADTGFAPPVTILKPVMGVEEGAYDNFASFCRQEYPRYQILFGTMDPDDPALAVIERLRADFPECEIDVVVCADEAGVNRKVSNLRNMARQARYEVLLISDADMRVRPEYLRRVMQPLRDKRVGMVTCPYRGMHPRGAAALLEALGISADFVPSTILAERLEGVRFAFGSTIAFPRRVLDAIGSWEALADYLADDFQMGNRAAAAGFRVCLSDYVVDSVIPAATLRQMLAHRLRWARTVRACRPAGYAGTYVTFGSVHALAFLLLTGCTPLGWAVVAGMAALRILTALSIAAQLGDRTVARWFWLLPAADLLSFAIWCASLLGKRVTWRGAAFRLLPGGKVQRIR